MFAQMIAKVFQKYIFILLFAAFCFSCAQVGSPSGGPRDEDPPRVLESDPPNYSLRFEEKKIQITFDEYIVLDNVNQELIVSPPMEEQPEVKLRKKTLIIEFEEALKENTTYTFNFGNAIKDLHEGNKLQNFEYVFSTGDVLDSMSVRGTLRYAETLEKPKEPISVMLYSDLRDSVPLTEIPLYVGRSDDSGVFSVNNLRPDEYKIFALKDGNNNFLFDVPSEEIAFLDSTLTVNTEFVRLLLGIEAPDTTGISADSSLVLADTRHDSLNVALEMSEDSTYSSLDSIPPGPDLTSIYVDMMLFTEPSEMQYLSDYGRDDRRRLELVFALPLSDTFQYNFLLGEGEGITYQEDFSEQRDSLTLWVIDSLHYKMDSLWMALQFTAKDTANKQVSVNDTLVFSYKEKTSKKKKRSESKTVEKLTVKTMRKGGFQDMHLGLGILLDFPLEKVTDSLISLYHIPDSVELAHPFSVEADSAVLNRATLSATWESDEDYRLQILPGAVTSVYPLEHDTIDVTFKTRDLEYYGIILLNLQNVNHQVMVQLLSNKKVVTEISVDENGQYVFPNLSPGKYTFKFIHDINENGRWDTGKYMEKRQPEAVEFLPGEIEVRSNWDHDVSVTLKK